MRAARLSWRDLPALTTFGKGTEARRSDNPLIRRVKHEPRISSSARAAFCLKSSRHIFRRGE